VFTATQNILQQKFLVSKTLFMWLL